MNNRFPFFRSDIKNRLRWKKQKQCYVPSLEEYTAPFVETGFDVLRSEHFCWIPHSASRFMAGVASHVVPDPKCARSLQGDEVVSRREEAL